MSVIFANYACADPESLRQECEDRDIPTPWYSQVNIFRSDLGREPGAGSILLRSGDIDKIDLTKDQELWFLDSTGTPPRKLKKITLLRGVCISPGGEGDEEATFLCSVVDRRWHLARVPVDTAYNVVCTTGSSYVASTLKSGVAWTWQQVVQDLATKLTIGTLTLPFTPHGTPENLVYYGGWAWDALNDVLGRLACDIEYDAETDTFSVVRLGVTTTDSATKSAAEVSRLAFSEMKLWDGFWTEPNRGKLPEKIRVLFPRRPQPTDGTSVYYTKDITLTAAAGVEAGSYEQLFDDMAALGSGTPSNAAALAARAQERADDWVRKRKYAEARQTVVYRDWQNGPKLICETIGGLIYDGRGGAARTEIVSAPDGLLEKWRPYDRPMLLGDCTTSASGSSTGSGTGTGSNTGTGSTSTSQSTSVSGSGSTSGTATGSVSASGSGGCPAISAVKDVACFAGVNRVTRGTLTISSGCLQWTNLTVTSEGCCACPGSASGSGTATGSNSTTGGGGGVFTTCCPPPIPQTLHLTFYGALAALGTITVNYNTVQSAWVSAGQAANTACTGAIGVLASLTCNSSTGKWEIVVSGTKGGSSFSLNISGIDATSCSPFSLSASGTATGTICAGPVTVSGSE